MERASELESMDADALRAAYALSLEKLAERDAELAELDDDHARLWRAYEALKEELALVKRRLFVASAERVDTTQLQLEFDELSAKLDALSGELPDEDGDPEDSAKPPKKGGRRNLKDVDLPEEHVEIPDPLFEQLVAEGKAERIGVEESYKITHKRGGTVRVRMSRIKYRAINRQGEAEIITAPLPKELIKGCLATASMLAHIASSKLCDGLPLYRQEDILSRTGFKIDRGTMSRWLEELGAAFGATVVQAMRHDALGAFCMMTDATGFAIQPGRFPEGDKKRRPCRKGHYFVQIADRDHIFIRYVERHTTKSVRALFNGYDGYVQADAASVYDALFRSDPKDEGDDGCTRTEVGCWSHARRKFWEAAFSKEPVAREALLRISKLFALDEKCRKRNPPSKIKRLRNEHMRPLLDELFDFVEAEYAKVKDRRGSLRSALGYCVRQRAALTAFLEDGRLRMDNNLSESELRKVVRIRDASLFAGSDEHAEAAGHILTLIASARLHHLDPEAYLRDLIRVLPYWPRERFLELAPKYWTATRGTLDLEQLDAELGPIDVPDASEQSAA